MMLFKEIYPDPGLISHHVPFEQLDSLLMKHTARKLDGGTGLFDLDFTC